MKDKLRIGISSGCLFDLRAFNTKLHSLNSDDAQKFIEDSQQDILPKGAAFALIDKLSGLSGVDLFLISRKPSSLSAIIKHNINVTNLIISKCIFTSGGCVKEPVVSHGIDLFLSTETDVVKEVLANRIPAAKVLDDFGSNQDHQGIRIAFDGDAVIFDDSVERLYVTRGLDAVYFHEKRLKNKPLPSGPLKPFLLKLDNIKKYVNLKHPGLIQTALITARSNKCSPRVHKTLSKWGLVFDKMFFMNGRNKNEAIWTFCPDIFFDDRLDHCIPASRLSTAAHVPWGVANSEK